LAPKFRTDDVFLQSSGTIGSIHTKIADALVEDQIDPDMSLVVSDRVTGHKSVCEDLADVSNTKEYLDVTRASIFMGGGFDIVFTSQSGETGHEEFVYLLRWKDRDTQVSAWKNFLANAEWIEIKRATSAKWGDLVDDVQDRSLDMLPYTPKSSPVP